MVQFVEKLSKFWHFVETDVLRTKLLTLQIINLDFFFFQGLDWAVQWRLHVAANWSSTSRFRDHVFAVPNLLSRDIWCQEKVSFKRAVNGLLFFIFVFSIPSVESKQMFDIKFANDWIRTADLWCQKRMLYQLSYNHRPPRKGWDMEKCRAKRDRIVILVQHLNHYLTYATRVSLCLCTEGYNRDIPMIIKRC